ncbi:hypothetical protein N5C67_03495 [Comamonas thiooxydans]|uniref:hypothetical protein n=1 Tax=Comamonas thiooxydans TaxID=363952 RepID=UPI00244A6446|nr:hypothetical protein [Comamonas thiooxydans]MDH1251711.1 hypothetical protein [Comamonas thiooxydans]
MKQVYVLYCETPYGVEGGVIASECLQPYRKELAIDLQALQQASSSIPALDAGIAAQAFGIGFTTVLMCFVFARMVGEILRLIRHG